ncbi:unnamed protein product [Anisakis simplex]|uniref:SUN domain-containing protein n=1 Tax=Anisakis simplex TaxID=6269 RepID=A0A0M3JU00_ANISI|nr:unnamed protein product [Anisakis simplex]
MSCCRCLTAEHCSLEVSGDICKIEFSFHFNEYDDAYKALSIYKLNDTLSFDAKKPLASSECIASRNQVTPFTLVTSFLYCSSQIQTVSSICEVSKSGNDTYASTASFTSSKTTSQSTSPPTTLRTRPSSHPTTSIEPDSTTAFASTTMLTSETTSQSTSTPTTSFNNLSSSHPNISTDPVSTIPSSDAPVLESTPPSIETTTTNFNWSSYDTFGGLANISLNGNNVEHVMKLVKNLLSQSNGEGRTGPDDVYQISLIIRNASRVNNLTQTVRYVQLDFDCFQIIKNFSFFRFLRSLPDLFRNAPSKVEYMNGSNLAMAGRAVKCSLTDDDDWNGELQGIADGGAKFELITGDEDEDDEHSASIHIPLDAICRSQAVKSFFVVYRNAKFFVGNESDYQIRDDERSEMPENRGCTVGQFLTNQRILTASLLDHNATIKQFNVSGTQQTMAIIRYSTKKVY